MRKVVEDIGRAIRAQSSRDNGFVEGVLGGAQRIVDVLGREGREAAAKSVFEAWHGVSWEEGPGRAQAWEFGPLMDLGDLGDLGDLVVHLDMGAAGLDVQEPAISV